MTKPILDVKNQPQASDVEISTNKAPMDCFTKENYARFRLFSVAAVACGVVVAVAVYSTSNKAS